MKTKRRILSKKDDRAVSPVIATLMLTLVAVGATAAFYVWQADWQNTQTGEVGDVDYQNSLTIAGSSTVYEFSIVGKELYQNENPSIKVDLKSGGSGSGIEAAGMGLVDIGSASKAVDSSYTDAYPDLDRDGNKDLTGELLITTVAYDKVDVLTGSDVGLVSINQTVLSTIYMVNGEGDDAAAYTTAVDPWLTPSGTGGKFLWSDIPAYAGEDGEWDGGTWDNAATPPSWTGTPTMCTGTEEITLYDREDDSGTEAIFFLNALGLDKSEHGGDQLDSAGIDATGGYGNQELKTLIESDPNALGFCSKGVVDSGFSGEVIEHAEDGGDDAYAPSSSDYYVMRPLNYITIDSNGDGKMDAGAAKSYLDFVLNPDVNQKICEEAGYISIYD